MSRDDHVPTHEQDWRLMQRVASGSESAQRVVVLRLFAPCSRVCRALHGSRDGAEDSTQLALMDVLRSAAGYRGESRLEAWAERVAARTALRQLRASRLRAARHEPLDPERHGSSWEPAGPVHVDAYLSRLPNVQRTALVLRHVLGYGVAEIATMEGVSPNTIKDRLLRARRALRKEIQRDENLTRAPGEGDD